MMSGDAEQVGQTSATKPNERAPSLIRRSAMRGDGMGPLQRRATVPVTTPAIGVLTVGEVATRLAALAAITDTNEPSFGRDVQAAI